MQSANGTERQLRDILFRQFDEMYHCLMIKSRRLRKINPNQVHPLPCSMYPTYPSPGTKRILLQQNKTDDKQPRQTLALIINGNCGGNSYISAQLILLYFAPFLEKVLDVQWLLQWMVWPLLATDIQTKRSAESCLETNFYFPNFFLGGEIFLCRLMIWRPVTEPFAISQIQMF